MESGLESLKIITLQPYAEMYPAISNAIKNGISTEKTIEAMKNALNIRIKEYMHSSRTLHEVPYVQCQTHPIVKKSGCTKCYHDALEFEEAKERLDNVDWEDVGGITIHPDFMWNEAESAYDALRGIERMEKGQKPYVGIRGDQKFIEYDGVVVEPDNKGKLTVKLVPKEEYGRRMKEKQEEKDEDFEEDMMKSIMEGTW